MLRLSISGSRVWEFRIWGLRVLGFRVTMGFSKVTGSPRGT